MTAAALPGGVLAGHWSDPERATGCTAVLCPTGAVVACEVRGGGPGTRESDLLSPASAIAGANAILLTGGSAFGLAAADGASRFLEERGVGVQTPAAKVPLVAAAVVYDLAIGDPAARPDADAAYAACLAASAVVERGSVGVGTGCTVGKLLGPEGATKGGLGFARLDVGGGAVAAIAAVNAFGEVVGEDGEVLAGAFDGERYVRTSELLLRGHGPPPARESTTLVCVVTDAELTKTQAWLVARSASAGVARAVAPSATAVDGDVVFCVAAGPGRGVRIDPFTVSALAADATAAAIRDAVRVATEIAGCESAGRRLDIPHPGDIGS